MKIGHSTVIQATDGNLWVTAQLWGTVYTITPTGTVLQTLISRHPASGSTRHSVELNLPGLRSWSVRRCPHIVFCVEATDHVDVWRVLHGTRDIPAWMQGPGRE